MHIDHSHFEWDAAKAQTNRQKHGVNFADAQEVFLDERAVTIEDPFPFEERFAILGADALGRVLVVVFAWRKERIRIISARSATSNERREYESG